MESSKEYLFKLFASFWLIILILLITLLVVVFVIKPERDDDYDLHYIISNIVVMVIGFLAAYHYPKKIIKRAKKKTGLREKLIPYRRAMILKWLILALVTLFSIFSFVMTREYIFVCATLFNIGVLFTLKTNKDLLADHLNLSIKEKSVLKVSDAAI